MVVLHRNSCLPLTRKVSARLVALTEGEIMYRSNYCRFCDMGFSPSVTFGAASQSLIEPSAVCLKADRQTIWFAALRRQILSSRVLLAARDQPALESEGFVRRCQSPCSAGALVRFPSGGAEERRNALCSLTDEAESHRVEPRNGVMPCGL